MGLAADEDWREPLPSLPGPDAVVSRSVLLSRAATWVAARRQDAYWARVHAAPWLARQVRGVSSGDGIPPKCPELMPMSPLQPL
jgi:hypothetical protein